MVSYFFPNVKLRIYLLEFHHLFLSQPCYIITSWTKGLSALMQLMLYFGGLTRSPEAPSNSYHSVLFIRLVTSHCFLFRIYHYVQREV